MRWPARWFGASGSIRRRLFLSSAMCCIVVLFVAGVALTAFYRTVAQRGFDERLQVYIKELVADLASPVEDGAATPGSLGEPRFELPLSGWYWQITRLGGDKPEIRGSRSLVGGQLASLESQGIKLSRRLLREAYVTGPDTRGLRAMERFIDVGEDGQFLVLVSGPADEIEDEITEFRRWLTFTFVLLGLALVASTLFQMAYSLKPLRRLGAAIEDVRTGETQRIDGDYPPDLAPLSTELNLLIDANHEILERARTQVGNLAHALKTPLSVMINEAASQDDPLAAKVREQATVMRDQVQYYLDRARAAAVSGALGGATDVQPVVTALKRTFEKIYADKALALANEVPESARFRGEKQDLEEMLGNLVDNACKWATGHVMVSIEQEPGIATFRLIIDDDGPGLPDGTAREVLRRGRRLDESKPGSGLGLSIVGDLAKLYGGGLELTKAPMGGLRVVLTLPRV
ncbi:MAG: ATP-binding protein [Bosea sp. (in: a-proteobacteria)]